MGNHFWNSAHWFNNALCCRCQTVRFGKLRVPLCEGGATTITEWHRAIAPSTSGQFYVLSARRDDGPATSQRSRPPSPWAAARQASRRRRGSGWLLQVARLDASGKVCERQFQGGRQPVEDADRGLLLADLDQGNERAIQVTPTRKIFLRQCELLPTRLDLHGKRVDELLISAGAHRAEVF